MDQKLIEDRKAYFDKMERYLSECYQPHEYLFYHHPNEDHIVLTHALFWMLSKPLAMKLKNHKHLQLLRKYEEEMLVAYLTEDDYFAELFRYCNIMYELSPHVNRSYAQEAKSEKLLHRLVGTLVVAAGYGGDVATDYAYELLDDLDFDRYGKVCSPKIESLFPFLEKKVSEEMSML